MQLKGMTGQAGSECALRVTAGSYVKVRPSPRKDREVAEISSEVVQRT